MSDLKLLSPGDPEIPTDPDILGVYQYRLGTETDQSHMVMSLITMANRLHWIARGTSPFTPVQVAAFALCEQGEQATPLPDEGVPCVF